MKAQMKKVVREMVACDGEYVTRSDWSIQLKRSSSTGSRSTQRELNTLKERDNIFTDIFFSHSLTGQQISNYSNLSSQIAMDCRNVSGVRVYVCTALKKTYVLCILKILVRLFRLFINRLKGSVILQFLLYSRHF